LEEGIHRRAQELLSQANDSIGVGSANKLQSDRTQSDRNQARVPGSIAALGCVRKKRKKEA
jgi:hypothetical protein